MSDTLANKNTQGFHTMLEPIAFMSNNPPTEFDILGDGANPETISINQLQNTISEVKNSRVGQGFAWMIILDFCVHNTVEISGPGELEKIPAALTGLITRVIQMPSKRNPEKVQKMMDFLSNSKLARNLEFSYRGCLGLMSEPMRLDVLEAIKSNPWVRNLNLSHNDLEDTHLSEIIDILKANSFLKRLGLASNAFRSPRALLSALIGHESMEMLDISRNRIPHLSQGTVNAMPAFKRFEINISNQL